MVAMLSMKDGRAAMFNGKRKQKSSTQRAAAGGFEIDEFEVEHAENSSQIVGASGWDLHVHPARAPSPDLHVHPLPTFRAGLWLLRRMRKCHHEREYPAAADTRLSSMQRRLRYLPVALLVAVCCLTLTGVSRMAAGM